MSLNVVVLQGRIGNNIELKRSEKGDAIANLSLAVDKNYVSKSGERGVDWINVVAWRTTAEFISKYFTKGSQILIQGSIQTRKYKTKDGEDRYATDIVAEHAYFSGPKRTDDASSAPVPTTAQPAFTPASAPVNVQFEDLDEEDGDLPF